ncbi:helix-turn-helix domain-containing protein [Amycolatopsis lurida]
MTRPASTRGAEPVLDEPTRQLCAAIAERRLTQVRLAVVAAGEHGKTALLEHLRALCSAAGLSVARFDPARADEPVDLVLADDAHTYGEAELAVLARLTGDERTGLVVAARPRPRPAGLNAVLGRLRGQILLRPLEKSQVAEHLSAHGVSTELAEFVRAQTGGVPGHVHRVVTALAAVPPSERGELPPAAFGGIRQELDRTEPGVLRFLLAVEAGAGPDIDLLGGLLGRDPEGVSAVIDLARATGLFGADGTLLPVTLAALRALVPAERHAAVRQRLVELQLERGAPVLRLVRPWLGKPIAGPSVAKAFEAAAEEALGSDPALAARLLEAAVAAGRPAAELGARRAEAVALAGDLDGALRLADEVIASSAATGRAEGARVAATALTHRGQLGRSAELLQWSGTRRSRAFAAISLIATGRRAEAERELEKAAEGGGDEPPTLLSGALSSVARGVVESVGGAPTAALSTLVSSAEMLEPVGRAVLLPDSPAALGALVALHSGELTIAEPLLERAIAARTGGVTLQARHQLLLAWIAMVRGDATLAAERLNAAEEVRQPRDWLFAVGLEVGLARRTSDLTALRRIWGVACEAVIRHPVDLFSFLPFGEFAMAAARLGERDRLAPHLAQAHSVLRGLGDPPLWAASLHWSELHAAIIAERAGEAKDHAAALAACAGNGAYFTAVSDAAACWLKVLDGDIDAEEVEAAAHALRGSGLWWDGARLAGQAAIRTTDRKAMVALLDCARLLQGAVSAPVPATEGATADDTPGSARLSDRELQVAELVLGGMTYKEVGARLFISAKTVEHHMARMRQRLGAGNRAELLAHLREMLGDR